MIKHRNICLKIMKSIPLAIFSMIVLANAGLSFANQDFQKLKQWAGKEPNEEINGKTFYDNKHVSDTLKNVLNKEIHDLLNDCLVDYCKHGYFEKCKIENNTIKCEYNCGQFFFEGTVVVYADTNNETIDVCVDYITCSEPGCDTVDNRIHFYYNGHLGTFDNNTTECFVSKFSEQ